VRNPGYAYTRRDAALPLQERDVLIEMRQAQIQRSHILHDYLLDLFIRTRPTAPAEVILDVDATDDPVHGGQALAGFCEARQRLGVAPLFQLARQVVALRATPDTPGAYYHGWRLMAVDGFVLDVADSAANARVFGRPGSSRSPAAFPQARVLALCEVGTHVLWRTQIKPYHRGEAAMTPVLLRALQADMLLLWDRNFLSFTLVKQVLN
jgi:hypothetical protein